MYEELAGWLRRISVIPTYCGAVDDCEKCEARDACAEFTNQNIIENAGKAADAIEELGKIVDHQAEILGEFGGETGIRQVFESAEGWAKMAAEYKDAYVAEHNARIEEIKALHDEWIKANAKRIELAPMPIVAPESPKEG